MGTLTGGLLTLMLSWVRGIVALFWRLADEGGARMLDGFARAWLPLSLAIIAVGLLLDRIVWLIHYGPGRFASGRGKKKPEDRGAREREGPAEDWLPEQPFGEPEKPETPEDAAEEVKNAAAAIPDAELAPYPGMRYDPAATGNTRRIPAAPREPQSGAPDRGSREEYERQMEIYRRKQTQYERDLAEYKRQKAAYDAAIAAEAKPGPARGTESGDEGEEAAGENGQGSAPRRRLRNGT